MGDAGGVTLLETKVGDKAKCPLISNIDGKGASLGDVLDTMQTAIEAAQADANVRTVCSHVVDLSGSAVGEVVWVADAAYTMACYLVYTEASSDNTGINIKVGKMVVGDDDDDDFFVVAVATEVSKATAYRKALTMAKTAVAAGDVITFTSAGGKVGTGNVMLQCVLTRV